MTLRMNSGFSKYHAIRTGKSASKKEDKRREQLELEQRAGLISDLRCQVRYNLIPTIREPDRIGPRGGVRPGKVIENKCDYIADFVYIRNGREIVEDCKGFKTPEYIIKRKLMLWRYGIRILET